jgi:hypothetical protein
VGCNEKEICENEIISFISVGDILTPVSEALKLKANFI